MAKKLGGFDAWLIGVAAMVGAGVFAVFGPAYGLAGNWLWLAVLIAGGIAALNANSVGWLAARFPQSGAGYRYSTEVLGPSAGFVTGLAFLIGKSGSVAAAALVIASAFETAVPGLLAAGVIVLAAVLNCFGITATARGVRFMAIPTIAVLVGLLVTTQFTFVPAGSAAVGSSPGSPVDAVHLLGAAGLIFFAFAGYARVATLAGEVRQPEWTVPRAMSTALASVLVLYLSFAFVLPATLGQRLATTSNALLTLSLELAGVWPSLVSAALLLAASASLLVLLAALSRTSEVMAADGHLPRILTRHSRFGTPWLAELSFAALAAIIALSGQVVLAISVSAGLVLVYYAFAHLAVIRHSSGWGPRLLAGAGVLCCLAVSASLDTRSVLVTAFTLLTGWLARLLIAKLRRVD